MVTLTYLRGRYILSAFVQSDEQIPRAFYEYGEKLPVPDDFELHLEEHGQPIIDHCELKKIFYLFKS